MPSAHTSTSGVHNSSMGSEGLLSPKSPSRKSSVSSMSAPPSQHFALATGMANPFAAPMPGFKTSRAKSASGSRTSLDRVFHPRRRATIGDNIQKDVRAAPISGSSTTTIECTTRKLNTSQSELLYPVSYRPEVLDRDVMDHEYLTMTKGLSFVDFRKGKPPVRCLDLGCGTGVWVLRAAAAWKESEFVGFDMADIQPKGPLLDRDIASRVRWVHGNFLTEPLPFDDDYFHHVRAMSIAKGVPEDKWDFLFDEIARVMAPGASFELVDEDILFPFIPRTSIDDRLRLTRTSSLPIETTFLDSKEQPPHDHALLESLFFGVFDRRFINTRPTKVIPQYLNYRFRHVVCGPYLSFPIPPPSLSKSRCLEADDASESEEEENDSLIIGDMPWANGPGGAKASKLSVTTAASIPTSARSEFSLSGSSHAGSDDESHLKLFDPPSKRTKERSRHSAASPRTPPTSPYLVPSVGARGIALHDCSLALHFFRAWQHVLGCQEAMWEECQRRKQERSKEPGLENMWWDVEEAKLPDKEKFNLLVARYEKDMRRRTALRYAVHKGLRWPIPRDDPMNSRPVMGNHWAAIEEEMDLEREMAARLTANEGEDGDDSANCRQIRAFVGWKLTPFENV